MIDAALTQSSQMSRLANQLLMARSEHNIGLIPFINCGDPDLTTTRALLSVCDHHQVCAVELGVPFGDSITDGTAILKSHDRALSQKIEFEDVIDLVRDLRRESSLPLFLLAEYSHSVRRRGLEAVVAQAKSAGVDGVLMHCLPPMLLRQYLDTARDYEMPTVLGLFPNSDPVQIEFVLSETTGFIYLASSFGKTGASTGLTQAALSFFKKIRHRTDQPLAVGFGLKTQEDLNAIFYSGIDAGIIGSPIAAIIEQYLDDSKAICAKVGHYFNQLQTKGGR